MNKKYFVMPNGYIWNDGSTIPNEPANSDYAAYLVWVAEGNTAPEWKPEA